MAELWIRTARHTAEVAAPPERVYELIADVNRWPEIFDPLWLSCVDGVNIAGEPRDVYDFLARAHDWPQRLPHIEALKVEEDVFDIQHLEAGIRLPNGSVHATSIVRVCFPETRIAYKQL